MNRRNLLWGVALVTAAGAAPAIARGEQFRGDAPRNPDADLLRLCNEFQAVFAECSAADAACDAALDANAPKEVHDRLWAVLDAAGDRENRLIEQITPIQPQTRTGLLAKARAVRDAGIHFHGREHRDLCQCAEDSIIADLLRLGGVA